MTLPSVATALNSPQTRNVTRTPHQLKPLVRRDKVGNPIIPGLNKAKTAPVAAKEILKSQTLFPQAVAPEAEQIANPSAKKPLSVVENSKTSAGKTVENNEFSFWDLVDIVNPLQHIPVVNTIYREITGDKINNVSRIAGGALFGGMAGAITGGVNAIAVSTTGQDIGEIALTKIGLKDAPQPAVPARREPTIEIHPSDKDLVLEKPARKAFSARIADAEPAAGLPETKAIERLAALETGEPEKDIYNNDDPIDPMSVEAKEVYGPMPPLLDIAAQMKAAMDKYQLMQSLSPEERRKS